MRGEVEVGIAKPNRPLNAALVHSPVSINPSDFLSSFLLYSQCSLSIYRFFSARKHGLVDAAVRNSDSDRTAVIALPGGMGTLDEMFEILSLIQLKRIGSQLPVPFLLMNYDGYYSKLLEFLKECEHWGALAEGEVDSLWKVFDNNEEALAYLAMFYDLLVKNEDGLKEQSNNCMK